MYFRYNSCDLYHTPIFIQGMFGVYFKYRKQAKIDKYYNYCIYYWQYKDLSIYMWGDKQEIWFPDNLSIVVSCCLCLCYIYSWAGWLLEKDRTLNWNYVWRHNCRGRPCRDWGSSSLFPVKMPDSYDFAGQGKNRENEL